MRLILFCLAIILISCSKNYNLTGHPSIRYKQSEITVFENEISSYGLMEQDTLVDIGSVDGINDELIFKFYPNMYFILEDIHDKFRSENKYAIKENGEKIYFKDHSKKITGTIDSIPLPTGLYNNVLC